MRTFLALSLLLLTPRMLRAEEPAATAVASEPRPWTIYGGLGFPGMTSLGLGRQIGPVELVVELGTFAPFPVLFTGAAHLQVDLLRGRRTALFAGLSASSLYFWFPGYEGEGEPFWNWGVGPKLGLRYGFRGHAVVAVEGGALYGEWDGTCKQCRLVPQAMVRVGWRF
jgi:hypothetical protein